SREKASFEDSAKLFSHLQRERKQAVILDALKIIDERVTSLEILYDGYPPMIYAELGLKQPMPIATMGDGFNRVFSLVLAMSAVQGGVLLIDEIENGLHYSIQTKIWKAIAKAAELFNVQIFATTHSFEMIRAAQEAFKETGEDDFRFYRLDRDPDTQDIEAVRYSPKTIDAAVRLEYEVRG
ncbi:MAG: AAA family ATPase, partial [Anaerolineae bacterium]|nr:AAA family ATPase [Anaerolineae bacterium]